jgi:eukaryotic-like serine/threonine-protein kinase
MELRSVTVANDWSGYHVYAEIGAGGMGTVHLGRRVGTGGFSRIVALKRLHPSRAAERDVVLMLLDEARLAARVQHPNVVSTLDVVANDDGVVLVFDYVLGETLARILRTCAERRVRFPVSVAAAIAIGTLHGLHAAHEARDAGGRRLDLIHRDVSPQNVMVGADGIPRVLDFGVAKAKGRLRTTVNGVVRGKAGYIAPEQLANRTSPRSDVYAAAVICWEMLTGRRLFPDLSGRADGEVKRPSEVREGISTALDDAVMRGLAADPDRRYPTAEAMALALAAAGEVASSSDIARFVSEIVGDRIADRARLVEAAEAGRVEPLHTIATPDDGSGAASASPDATTAPLTGDAQVSRAKRGRTARWLALSAALVAAFAAAVITRVPRSEVERLEAESTAPPPTEVRGGDEPEVEETVAATVTDTTTTSPSPPSTALAPNAARSRPPSPRRPASTKRRPSAPARDVDCTIPWVLSEDGRKKLVRRECF